MRISTNFQESVTVHIVLFYVWTQLFLALHVLFNSPLQKWKWDWNRPSNGPRKSCYECWLTLHERKIHSHQLVQTVMWYRQWILLLHCFLDDIKIRAFATAIVFRRLLMMDCPNHSLEHCLMGLSGWTNLVFLKLQEWRISFTFCARSRLAIKIYRDQKSYLIK